MGRPLKMSNSPLRNMAMLRDEFAALAAKTDGYFSRLRVQREPLVKEDGTLDLETLKALSDGFVDEKNLLVISDWAHDAADPECYHEFLWGRGDDHSGVLEAFDELSESALRSIASVAGLSDRLKLYPADLVDYLAWDSYWLDLLIKIGSTRSHPVVRTAVGSLSYGRRYSDCEFFSVGSHTIVLRAPPPDMLKRLKKLARAKSHYEELKCGILRGSAYALDWLIPEAEAKNFR